jgi:ArsR family transcriptional regulator, arsenate/arsenite/antimonite-responsive transcriptional repressor
LTALQTPDIRIILEMSERAMNVTETVTALGALAHEHRLAIYRMLVERGPNGLAAGNIAERLDIPPSSLTFHLQHLLRAGLITQRRMSRQLIYAADFSAMNALVGFLTENCCGQGPAACLPACLPPLSPPVASDTRKTMP